MNQQGIKIDNPVDPSVFFQYLLAKNGPDRSDYAAFDRFIETVSDEAVSGFKTGLGEQYLQETIHGHVLRQPFGYAGDFLVIDKIYTQHCSEKEEFGKWDQYFHRHAAPKAVRNRKDYFKRVMGRILRERKGQPTTLLNLASGPARDLAELYQTIDPKTLKTTCVDLDAHAIEYATRLNERWLKQIEFVHRNIFKFRPEENFDVIWSAGLFDYFDDATFVGILGKIRTWANPGGEIIIGNFSEENPSRRYMEAFGEWFLHHRSPAQLMRIALQAGFTRAQVRVGKESEGVNLFMHLQV
ncbi:MAG: class I SAM-dependent methyltransferase [Saprospiraceae bacterium]